MEISGLKPVMEGIQGSFQIWRLEQGLILKLAPLRISSLDLMISIQIQEQELKEISSWRKDFPLRYLVLRSCTQRMSSFTAMDQASFAMRALFKSFILLKPRPPPDLGVQIESQHFSIKEFPLEFSPHQNFLI